MQLLPPASLSSPVGAAHLQKDSAARDSPEHEDANITLTEDARGPASHLKTPPSSTLRVSSGDQLHAPSTSMSMSRLPAPSAAAAAAADNGNDDNRSQPSPSRKHGLLSPEFSSPNLYDHTLINNNFLANTGNSSIDTDNDADRAVDIKIIIDAPTSSPPIQQRPKKRITDANASTSAKRSKLSPPEDFVLPKPEDMPPVPKVDGKPSLSYATLIGMAILRAPDRRLTLAEIYAWISSHFPYYKKGDVGWQNSIRHNLSLNKAFEKTEKSKDRKGHFWEIVKGSEHLYCNIKESKKPNASSSSSSLKNSSNSFLEPSTPTKSSSIQLASSPNTPISLNASLSSRSRSGSFSKSKSTAHANANANWDKNFNLHSNNKYQTLSSLNNTLGGNFPLNTIQESNQYTPLQLQLLPPIPSHIINDSPSQLSSLSLDYTSSFSCRSNFELSPLKPSEPGPILPLEPVTPNRSNVQQKSHLVQLPPISKHLQSLNPTPITMKISGSTSNASNPSNLNYSAFSKKLWASPSYLDDFYTSPIAPQYHSQTLYGSPLPKRKLLQGSAATARLQSTLSANVNSKHFKSLSMGPSSSSSSSSSSWPSFSSSSSLPVRASQTKSLDPLLLSNVTNGYSTNEIFGIDVCTLSNNIDDNED